LSDKNSNSENLDNKENGNQFFTIKKINKDIKNKEEIKFDKVAFFGQILEDKGVLDLLYAFRNVSESRTNITLDIWGGNLDLNSDNFIKKFNYLVEEINTKLGRKAVTIKGKFKNSDVVNLMASYKTIVIPSMWPETFSLVYSEAILAGTNVVAPKIGAFIDRAQFNKYKTILYDVSNISAMSKAINLSLSLPVILRKKVVAEIDVKEDFSIETMTKTYLKL
jgi:glycosyltransferase involved in cell wall biosynthesis